MKTTLRMMWSFLLAGATCAYAASGSDAGEISGVTLLFLGFLALIVVMQLIPSLFLFYSLIKGLLTPLARKQVVPANSSTDDEHGV